MNSKKEYDDNGNVITRTWHYSEGNVECSYKYTYEDKGNKSSKTYYDSEGNEV